MKMEMFETSEKAKLGGGQAYDRSSDEGAAVS
jgi:hypothetical protein